MDTLDYIFGPMGSWSSSETFGESQPVIGVSDEPAEVVTQGLPARCTGSSRLGSDFLANSPLRADGFQPEKVLGTPTLDVAQVEVTLVVDSHRMHPVELARMAGRWEMSQGGVNRPSGVNTITSWSLGGMPTTRPGMGNLGRRRSVGDEPHT